jgi:hypothetical protein
MTVVEFLISVPKLDRQLCLIIELGEMIARV